MVFENKPAMGMLAGRGCEVANMPVTERLHLLVSRQHEKNRRDGGEGDDDEQCRWSSRAK